MKKWFKRGLFALVVFVIVALVGAAVFLLTFDPNAYKNKVAELVYERYQRQLEIKGDIELSLFPRIGLSVEKVTLSDHESDALFASLDSARFAVAVWPLLWNRLVVDHVAINGAKVWLSRDENGQFNFTDLIQRSPQKPKKTSAYSIVPPVQAQNSLLAPDASQAEFQIDIAGLSLKESALHFHDFASDTQQQVVDLELNTGRMTFGQSFDVIFKGQLQGDKPVSDAQVEGQALLQVEPHLHRYAAQRINLSMVGKIGAYQAQSATLRGGLEWLVHTQDIRARQIELLTQGRWQSEQTLAEKINWSFTAAQLNLKHSLSVLHAQKAQWRLNAQLAKTPSQDEQKLEIALDIPRLALEPEHVDSDPIALSFKQTQGAQMFGLNTRIKNLGGTAQQIKLHQLQLDLAHKDNAQAWKWSTTANALWHAETTHLSWDNMITHVHLEDEALTPNPAQAKIEGQGQWDGIKKEVQFSGKWNSANTHAGILLTAQNTDSWRINADIDAERIDVSPWLIADALQHERAVARQQRRQSNSRLLIDQLDWRDFYAQINLQTKHFLFKKIQMDDLSARIQQENRGLTFKQWTATSFDGRLAATGKWHHDTAQGEIKAKWQEMDLLAFSQAFEAPLQWAGQGSVSMDLVTTGWTRAARAANLTGKTMLQAKQAHLVGWGFWPYLQETNQAVRNIFSGQVKEPNGQFNSAHNTTLSDVNQEVNWQQGQGQLVKMTANAPGLRLRVEPHSYFDAVNRQLNLDLRFDLQRKSIPTSYADLSVFASHPVYISARGQWGAPDFKMDWMRLQQVEVKQAIEAGLLSTFTGGDVAEAISRPLPATSAKAAEQAAKGLGSTIKELLKK